MVRLTRPDSRWLPLVLAALLAALTFWLNEAVRNAGPAERKVVGHDIDYIVDNFSARQFGVGGVVHYTLAARKMIHYADDDAAHLEDVKFAAFEPAQPPIAVASDRAKVTSKATELFFYGGVVITRAATPAAPLLAIRTSYLHALPDAGIADTDQVVVADQGDDRILATGMVLNSKTRQAELKHAKATFMPVPPQPGR